MKIFKLKNMKKGWFIGDFDPTCFKTKDFEVACKNYKKGEKEGRHVHRVATEFTLIQSGRAKMNGKRMKAGDIMVLKPGETSDFEALEDGVTVVVKVPSVRGDKHILSESTN